MVHSYGDYPSLENLEFLYTTSSLGNMEECQLTKEWNPDAPFEASYCTVIYPLFATGMVSNTLVIQSGSEEVDRDW